MLEQPARTILQDASLRDALPSSFLWGCASASHQIEGAIDADGKGLNIWDVALADRPNANGRDACNSYYQWKEDIELLKRYGCNSYRFSISWARIKPLGGGDDPVNEKGIEYYLTLLDALIKAGIEPLVTIFHWDHPQELEARYKSFSSETDIIRDFVAFADVLFERFGSRCKKWITINEPHIFTMKAGVTFMKTRFDLQLDFTRLARTLILCHAHTVALYRSKYQSAQGGSIGITLNCDWAEPLDNSDRAKKAAQLTLDLQMSLYADPIFLGQYTHPLLREEYGDSLPQFSDEEWHLIKGSFGLNHYGTCYTTGERVSEEEAGGPGPVWSFARTVKVYEKDGVPIGTRGENGHPYDVPWGFRKLLRYINQTYCKVADVPIWITENGMGVEGEATFSREQQLRDITRQRYYAGYLREMMLSIVEDKVPIDAYMAWSLLDNLEWDHGYVPRFGITVVDRADGFKRHPKDSALMLKGIFHYLIRN